MQRVGVHRAFDAPGAARGESFGLSAATSWAASDVVAEYATLERARLDLDPPPPLRPIQVANIDRGDGGCAEVALPVWRHPDRPGRHL